MTSENELAQDRHQGALALGPSCECSTGLGRVEKAKRALLAVCAAGDDVEALCALAYLEAREKPGGREAVQFMRKAMCLGQDKGREGSQRQQTE